MCGKVLLGGWATGAGSEKLLEAPPSLTEPMPDGSKMDPPLAKAISDSGRLIWDNTLRRGEKKISTCAVAARERSENM